MMRKFINIAILLIVVIMLFSACGNVVSEKSRTTDGKENMKIEHIDYLGIGTYSSHIVVSGYPAYIYRVSGASIDEFSPWYNSNLDTFVPSDVYYVVSTSKSNIDEEISFSIQGASLKGFVKAIEEFTIQKEDKGETFIISYYSSSSYASAFKSKEDAEKQIKNTKRTVEISKENVIIFYE
ncbi:MAG: hypothetical protein E7680_01445 [Ruminococcaceae bacterium]|nr:hypothetical protein [Oscillospiraceae bacterium]